MSKTDSRRLATFAAEAWTRARQPAPVLALAEAHELDDETFWRAEAHALAGDLPAARRLLAEDENSPRSERTTLLLAQVLIALKEYDAARAELERLTALEAPNLRAEAQLLRREIDLQHGLSTDTTPNDADNPRVDYLIARSQLKDGQTQSAMKALERILSSSGGGQRLHQAATLLQAAVLMQEGSSSEARDHLIQFLDMTEECDLWQESFSLLEQTRREETPPPPLPEAVLRWIAYGNAAQQAPEPPPALQKAILEFRGHALLLVAEWLADEGRYADAAGLAETFLQLVPDHPSNGHAMRTAMELYARLGAAERVLSLANSWRKRFGKDSAQVDFTVGGIQYERGDHWHAVASFQNAANIAGTLGERRRGLYNAATSAILAGDFGLYQTLLGQLAVASGPDDETKDTTVSAATLELEKALYLAAQRKDGAEASLRAFIRDHVGHPRFADACIALAEWLLLESPPRVADAKETLGQLADTSLADPLKQRVEFTRLWLLDASGDTKGLLAAAEAYLKGWPRGLFAPEVHLQIASAHYRDEDFANARTEFEIIARDYPQTPHADTALYFAALCASSVMSEEGRTRAAVIWDELAAKGGPLAVAARLQQAVSQRQQGDHAAALATLDKILAMRSLDVEQRRMTLCDKAEVLLVLGRTDPTQLDNGVALLEAFLADSSLPLVWKARAGFTLASLEHEAGRDSEALDACYNVRHAAEITPPATPADYSWFAKAGFFGIDLLEASRQWESAARLAEQIADQPGERATEAHARATKIRLEHFLWDGPAPKPPKVLEFNEKAAAPRKK
ncbi:MAG: outer membrane protein assembly factor BamD [Prosthecobacter sp.]